MEQQDEFSYENILRKNMGLLDIKIKVSIRDTECLSMVYTPGVATPCLEIQKEPEKAYSYTNKGNSILILTDSSNCPKNEKGRWTNNAAMPYLEAVCAYYKVIGGIDAYPVILDMKLIKDADILVDTVNSISYAYHGVEFFMMCPDRMKELYEKIKATKRNDQYAYIDASCKCEIDEMLKKKKTDVTSNSIFAAIWRATLDARSTKNLNECLKHIIHLIETDKIDLKNGNEFYVDFMKIFEHVVDFIFEKKMENHHFDKYNWREMPVSKELCHKKLQTFLTYGTKGWVEEMPKGYFMHKHSNPENSNLIHARNKGVIEIGLKINITSPAALKKLFTWKNIEGISKKILDNPHEVYELTCKHNYGAIITNGTAILGLGNIGAVSGMPVMEGKSVLFKYFGGSNIAPFCIEEMDIEKMIAYCQRMAPSFSIINLEDIKGPDCFFIETKLIETVECPMFHDDQHGTAIVTLAGLINAWRLRGGKKEDMRIVMNGAGAAGISVTQLLITYGFKNFIVCDTAGALFKGRTNNMNHFKEILADMTNPNKVEGKLTDVIKGADCVIGVSGPNTISKEDVKKMNDKPIVFALANPIPEIFPKDAIEAGAYIVATGRSDYPNQINNSLVFPGLFRGTLDTRAPKITLEMKIAAAEAIAHLVTPDQLRPDFIMPSALNVTTSINVAKDVAKVVIEKKQTLMTNLNLDKIQENIHSFFIDSEIINVER